MTRTLRLTLALLVVSAAIAVLLYVALTRSDGDDAGALLARSGRAMTDESFSYVIDDCALCPPPVVTEYAPPGRLKLSNPGARDSWRLFLLIGDQAYASSLGVRWLSGVDASASFSRLIDPRFMAGVVRDARFEADEEVGDRPARVVAAQLDVDAFLAQPIFAGLDAESEAAMRDQLAGTSARFWIDAQDERVLQMALAFPGPDSEPRVQRFDFETPVSLPVSVESLDVEVARRLGQEAEPGGEALLRAVREYHQRNGRYPPRLDPATLADVLPAEDWPTNPFNGQPMRQSDDIPGNFGYTLKNNGADIEFRLYAWDDLQMFYDSERFGPIAIP